MLNRLYTLPVLGFLGAWISWHFSWNSSWTSTWISLLPDWHWLLPSHETPKVQIVRIQSSINVQSNSTKEALGDETLLNAGQTNSPLLVELRRHLAGSSACDLVLLLRSHDELTSSLSNLKVRESSLQLFLGGYHLFQERLSWRHTVHHPPCFILSDVLLENMDEGQKENLNVWKRRADSDSVEWDGWEYLTTGRQPWTPSGLYNLECLFKLNLTTSIDEWMEHGWWKEFAKNKVTGYRIPLPLITVSEHISSHHDDAARHDMAVDSYKFSGDYAQVKRYYSPLVSVIIPLHNLRRISWLNDMFQSLWYQTLLDFEVIIVDDASDKDVTLVFLRHLQKYLQKTRNWWHSENFTSITPTNRSIPMYLIRHQVNRGLSAVRNTGASIAKAPSIFFLDPDDLVAPHALESMVLASFGSVLPQPRTNRMNEQIAFLHPAVVHFSGESPSWIRRWDSMQYRTASAGESPRHAAFRVPVTKQVPFDKEALKVENHWTSAALIHRKTYINIGGMCTRKRGFTFFEDWEFWMRMASFGYTGLSVSGSALNSAGDVGQVMPGHSVGEGLFWYRRHDEGQSSVIRRQSEKEDRLGKWMAQLKQQSPVLFDQMSGRDIELLMWQRQKFIPRRDGPMTISKRDEMRLELLAGVVNDTSFLPCYFPFETDETIHTADSAIYNFVLKHTHLFPYPHDTISDVRNRSTPRLFPFLNPEYVGKDQALYLTPWAVTGGADIYDLQALKALNHFEINPTILFARTIPIQQQALLYNFSSVGLELVNLQLISNDTEIQELALMYYLVSRRISLFVFRASVVGYRFATRWQSLRCGDNQHDFEGLAPEFIFGIRENHIILGKDYLSLIDINHLQVPDDLSGWEWRSGRVFCSLNSRVVVSENLKSYMLDVVKNGNDTTLKVHDTAPNFQYAWDPARESSRIHVIHPPAVVDDWSLECEQNTNVNQTNVFFYGRYEMQKDPFLFLFTAMLGDVDFSFHMHGEGSLKAQLQDYLWQIKPSNNSIEIHGVSSHHEIGRQLAKNPDSILLTTSRFDGLSMIILEALAFGIPVVALDCSAKTGGGIRELLDILPDFPDEFPMLSLVEPVFDHETRPKETFEGSSCHFYYESTAQLLYEKLVTVRAALRAQRTAHDGDSCAAHRYRYAHMKSFRHYFSVESFREKWTRLKK